MTAIINLNKLSSPASGMNNPDTGRCFLILDSDGILKKKNPDGQLISLEGGDSIASADNGLSSSLGNVQLGGSLIQPTSIAGSGLNTFSITDSVGTMIKTRDSNGNFILNAVYGLPTFTNSSLIFAFTSDGGTTFTDSNIVYNFGGANNFNGAVDVFSFGDYHTFTSTFQSVNFGRGNSFTSSSNIHLLGDFNTLTNCYGVNVFGNNNNITSQTNKYVVGNNNQNLVVDGNNGNVGIGTLSPSAKLDILTTSGIVALNINSNSATDSIINLSTNNSGTVRGKIWLDNTNQTLNFYTLNNDTVFWNGIGLAQSETMRLTSSGNVGIGTTNPTSRLHTNGTFLFTSDAVPEESDNMMYFTIPSGASAGWKTGLTIKVNSAEAGANFKGLYVATQGVGNSVAGQFYNTISGTNVSLANAYYAVSVGTGDIYINAGNIYSRGANDLSGSYSANFINASSSKYWQFRNDGVSASNGDLYVGGNVGFGSGIDSNTKLIVRGNGTTGATAALRVQNSIASNLIQVLDNGATTFNTTVDTWGTYTFASSGGNIVGINAGGVGAGLLVSASAGSFQFDVYSTTTRLRAYTTDFYISRGASELERISFAENFIRINAATGVGINTYNVQATLDITGIDASVGYSLRLRDNSSIDKFKFRNDGSLMISNGGYESTIKQVFETDVYNSYLSISPANNTFKMYFSEVGFGHWNYGAGNPNVSPWDGASLLHKNRGFEVVNYGGNSTFIRVQASTDLQQLVFDNSNKMFLSTNFFHTKAVTGGTSFFQVDQTDAGNGQVKVGIGGIALGSVHSSAILEIKSNNKGFLPPRMLGSQVEAIATPAEGLIAYATDGSGTTVNTKGWWGYDGTTWVKLN